MFYNFVDTLGKYGCFAVAENLVVTYFSILSTGCVNSLKVLEIILH